MSKEKKPGLGTNVWMYALGVMGINLTIGLVNSYQAEFFNGILGADLMIFSVILLVSKFVSIIGDFVIGHLIDKCRFKSGKMRPWILMSAFPFAVLTILSFAAIDFKSDFVMYVYITIITVLWNISMTMADVPSQGILALISHNGEVKNSAAGLANTLRSISISASGVFMTIVCMLTGNEITTKLEYYIGTGIMVALALVFQILMYLKTKEVVVSDEPSTTSFKEMFKELKNNKMLLIMFSSYLLGFGRNIGMGIAIQSTYIFLREGVDLSALSFLGMEGRMYGGAISWLITITCAVSTMVGTLLNAQINKRLGEKKYFLWSAGYGFVVSLICTVAYCTGSAALRSLPAILVYQFFQGFAFAPNTFLPMVMTSDAVDYQEWKTGKRSEGLAFALLSMANKLSNALSVFAGLFLYAVISFDTAKASGIIETAPQTISTYITDTMQNQAWIIYFMIPGICMLLSAIPMLFYKLDEPTKKVMRKELAERRAAAGIVIDENAVIKPML